jgi:hypothetical protein
VSWLGADFEIPQRIELDTGHHLRPMREADVDIDYPAVMGSRERLWAKYGEAWGWPTERMSFEADREDLARHEREILAKDTFLYGVFDQDETRLFGCVYVDPPEEDAPEGSDAMASWWVIDDEAGGRLERALDEAVPRWLRDAWSFQAVHYHP